MWELPCSTDSQRVRVVLLWPPASVPGQGPSSVPAVVWPAPHDRGDRGSARGGVRTLSALHILQHEDLSKIWGNLALGMLNQYFFIS